MWNLSPCREVNLFHRKMPTVPALEISWNFNIFSKFTKFHQTCRTYLNHHQKHACEIWAQSEKLTYFTEKCRQCWPFEISWNFNIFSKVTKFHQTCRTYWNHHQKHACEIWAHSKKLTYFIEKCWQCRPFEISWNFNIFSKFIKFHQTCRTYWNHHQKHACAIWAFSEKLTYFIEKCRQCRPFIISWNFNIFSKFTKFHQTCRTYLKHHQKHACEIWANSEKLTYFTEKCRQCPLKYHEISTFFKSHQISSNLQNILESSSETCMWNLSPFREVNLFDRKMLTVPALWNIMKFQHFFKVHQISSNLQNSFESSSETCMWNLSPFREVIFFHKKMLTVQALEISWNFNIFSKFTKFHQTCRTYLNHHQKHACEIWANSEKLTYFTEKWRQCGPFEISWNFNIFSKFTKFHQTCRTYLNHHQKHACEIWENSEKLTYFIEKCWQCGPLKYHEISTFFQSSPNFIKLAEHIGIIIRNMHVKFEPIQKSWLISQKNADSAGPLKYHEISTFFQSSPNFIKLAEHIWIIIRNMHVKFEPIQKSWLISQKNADSAGPLKYHEISTFFQSSPNFIKLAEHIGIIIRNMHVKFEPIQRS